MLIALILSVVIYSITWILLLSLNQSHENCTSIAVEAANRNVCVAIFVIRLMSQDQCDFANLFPSATVLMTFLMLTAHSLWNICRFVYATLIEIQHQLQNLNETHGKYSWFSKINSIFRPNTDTAVRFQRLEETHSA